VSDTSQLIGNRKIDESYKPRIFTLSLAVIFSIVAILSFFAGTDSAMLMHRQGRIIQRAAKARC